MTDLYLRKLAWNPEWKRQGNEYPFGLPVVRMMGELTLRSRVTLFVGENGSGKSTLLEAAAVACGFNPEGGSRNFCFDTHSTHSPLYRYLKLVKGPRRPRDGFFLRAESFYNLSTELECLDQVEGAPPGLLNSYGGKSLHEQSHGESFLSLVGKRFRGNGLYILDEPEAALSPSRQLALMALIFDLEKRDSQFLIATHSPILMAYPGADLFEITQDRFERVDYRDTQHYQLTRRFLNHPESVLRELLGTLEPTRDQGESGDV
ncbi:MAG: AAA family ATPase [Clostridiales bacterium]|jgi:predicted ATPase|nr:AAA family ATPase [Clostridiales bacterium]